MRPPTLARFLCASLLSSAALHGAIQIANYSSAANDRFANDPQFVGNAYDLSGVAIAPTSENQFGSDDGGRWLTMLSPKVYISAHHFNPNPGSTVTFYSGNDPSGASVTRTLTSNTLKIGNTDLYLGTLDSALPGNYAYYDFATEDATNLSTFSATPYAGANAYVFGRSPATGFPISQDMAVGRNRIDVWFGLVTVSGNTGYAVGAAINSPGDANYVTHEADLRVGDSGAPLFVDTGSGTLTMVGVNWFTSNPSGSFLGTTYLGNYDHLIQDFIDASTPVPEPAALGLIAGLISAIVASRRFRRS